MRSVHACVVCVCVTVLSKAQKRDELIGAEGEDFCKARRPQSAIMHHLQVERCKLKTTQQNRPAQGRMGMLGLSRYQHTRPPAIQARCSLMVRYNCEQIVEPSRPRQSDAPRSRNTGDLHCGQQRRRSRRSLCTSTSSVVRNLRRLSKASHDKLSAAQIFSQRAA